MNGRYIVSLALCTLLAGPAYATGTKPPAPKPVPTKIDVDVEVVNKSRSSSESAASSDQSQGQFQGQSQSAASDQAQSQSANNEGNSQDVSINNQRSAPSMGQGSIMLATCGAAGNAGGSNTSGSAFLGFGYVTQKCYDLLYAAAYAALGERQAACDILRKSKFGRKAQKRYGIDLPVECVAEKTTIVVPPATDLTNYPTREEVNERVDRAFRKSQEK